MGNTTSSYELIPKTDDDPFTLSQERSLKYCYYSQMTHIGKLTAITHDTDITFKVSAATFTIRSELYKRADDVMRYLDQFADKYVKVIYLKEEHRILPISVYRPFVIEPAEQLIAHVEIVSIDNTSADMTKIKLIHSGGIADALLFRDNPKYATICRVLESKYVTITCVNQVNIGITTYPVLLDIRSAKLSDVTRSVNITINVTIHHPEQREIIGTSDGKPLTKRYLVPIEIASGCELDKTYNVTYKTIDDTWRQVLAVEAAVL